VTGPASDYPPELARLTPVPDGAGVGVLSYGAGPDQVGELWSVDRRGPRPVVVLVHGGYWRSRYRLDVMHALAGDLLRRGVAVWNLEYRRVGSPGGGWPGTFEDVAAGLDMLRELAGPCGLDLDRVAVLGHSAGGHLALWLAARHRLARGWPGAEPRLRPRLAVGLAPVADLAEAARRRLSDDAVVGLLGYRPDERPDVYRQASPFALLPLGVRQILVHGTADASVPVDLSRRYRVAAGRGGDPCELVLLDGVDHFALIDPATEAWRSTADAVLAELGGRDG
jgi:acetyl esterase/lipase